METAIIARIPLIPEVGEKFGAANLFLTRSQGEVRKEFESGVKKIVDFLSTED